MGVSTYHVSVASHSSNAFLCKFIVEILERHHFVFFFRVFNSQRRVLDVIFLKVLTI